MKAKHLEQYEMEKYLFHKGESYKSYEFFGAHRQPDGSYSFSVWAPNAKGVRLVGDFNHWNGIGFEMVKIGENGIYNLITDQVQAGDLYKYEIITQKGKHLLKADPYAVYAELRPGTASRVYELGGYNWQDKAWISQRKRKKPYRQPLNIYEIHLGSWMLKPDGSFHSYEELAPLLVPYLKENGYTHVEFMPLMEHPFDGSWGYQTTGFYAATSRYGTPEELMYLIDYCHQHEIGVILDWVPCHYCRDAHGLSYFDGNYCYESAYQNVAVNHQWGTNHFDFSRKEVWSFLISNAMFWMDHYHIDGLRVDAVAYMIYADYGKPGSDGVHGYKDNLDAVAFIQKLNEVVFSSFPNVLMIAEESSAWPKLTHPVYEGGLGFNYKWNMGWMNDTLKYFSMDYEERKNAHHLLNFSMMYAFSENFILPFSHDEVVHGKKSLIGRMPGDYWQKFANLRLLLGYAMTHPGKKLSFMGTELGHFIEWNYQRELDWFLKKYDMHQKFAEYAKTLNRFYLEHPALYEIDDSFKGFKWIDPDNAAQSVLLYERRGRKRADDLIIALNCSPVTYEHFWVGVKDKSPWEEIFNSDNNIFGGAGVIQTEPLIPEKKQWQHQKFAVAIKLPALSIVILTKKKAGDLLG